MKEDPTCSERGIPARLHQLDRGVVPDFDPSELFYRRYNAAEVTDQGLADAAITFRNDGMSVNRSKFSERADDVFFKVIAPGRHEGYAYLTFKADAVSGFEWEHPDSKAKHKIKVDHNPHPCMYPHSLIKLLKDGKEVEGVKSRARSLELKEKFIMHCCVH